jgi:hypothetical protein
MGGSKAGCNGSRDIAIEPFFHGKKSSKIMSKLDNLRK